jgi:hypothetical protein
MGWFGKKKEQDPLNLKDTKSTLTETQKELIQKMGVRERAKEQKEWSARMKLIEDEDEAVIQKDIKFRNDVMERRRKEDIKYGWRSPDEEEG